MRTSRLRLWYCGDNNFIAISQSADHGRKINSVHAQVVHIIMTFVICIHNRM